MNLATLLDDIAREVIAQEAAPFTQVFAGWDELAQLVHSMPENEDTDTAVTIAREIAATAVRFILDMEGAAHADPKTV